MSRLIAKEIIRSYSMLMTRTCCCCKAPLVLYPIVMFVVDLMFNTQRYMHMNDAYFVPSTIRFPYELKKIFNRILHELQYLDKEHPHHFALDLDQLDRIFEYRFIQSSSYSFPVTNVELEYMFETLGFM